MALKSDTVVINGGRGRRSSPFFFALALMLGVSAATTGYAADPESGPSSQSGDANEHGSLWLNPGLYSFHYQDKGFNDNNYGIGAEYRYSDTQSVTAGEYKNSDRHISHYLSWYWQPFAIGPVKIGATFGALDGYPAYHHGDWFVAVIPAATYEGRRFGLNVLVTPNYKDRLYGAVSLQLKIRVW